MQTYRYYIVESPGMHGQSETVRPRKRTNRSLAMAVQMARQATDAYQQAMRPYGGSGGYYRVISGRNPWIGMGGIMGMDLDRIPSVQGSEEATRNLKT